MRAPLLPDKLPRKHCRGMGQKGWPVTMKQGWGEGSKHISGGEGLQAGGRGYVMKYPYSHQGHPWTMVLSWEPAWLETEIWVDLS